MTVTDTTAPSQDSSVSLQLDLNHSPAKVWRALTTPALLSEWLMPVAHIDLESGAPFTFRAKPQPGWGGVVNCRFIEIEPEKKLCYTWDSGDVATVVTFELSPTPAGTRLSVVQSGFKPEQKRNFSGARYGWKMMGEKLEQVLESPVRDAVDLNAP